MHWDWCKMGDMKWVNLILTLTCFDPIKVYFGTWHTPQTPTFQKYLVKNVTRKAVKFLVIRQWVTVLEGWDYSLGKMELVLADAKVQCLKLECYTWHGTVRHWYIWDYKTVEKSYAIYKKANANVWFTFSLILTLRCL